MRYLRPFDLDGPSGPDAAWLLAAEEGLGCSIRLIRGGGAPMRLSAGSHERIAIVFRGCVTLSAQGQSFEAEKGSLLFLPAGQEGAFSGPDGSAWVEVTTGQSIANYADTSLSAPKSVPIDPDSFLGTGFAYQAQLDRSRGASSIRVNALQVSPKSGSPDWHIHPFAQMYLIQEGEMTVQIGRTWREIAGPNTLVILPEGVVHRNFNASDTIERHTAFLVPEPEKDAIFDYAVTIHEREAEMMDKLPD